MRYVGSRHPLARANPLRSMPLFRPVPVDRTPEFYAAWELDRASVVLPGLEQQFVYAREVLGRANQRPRICRRRFQSQAMSFLNRARAALHAGRARMAKAQAAVEALRVQLQLALAA